MYAFEKAVAKLEKKAKDMKSEAEGRLKKSEKSEKSEKPKGK